MVESDKIFKIDGNTNTHQERVNQINRMSDGDMWNLLYFELKPSDLSKLFEGIKLLANQKQNEMPMQQLKNPVQNPDEKNLEILKRQIEYQIKILVECYPKDDRLRYKAEFFKELNEIIGASDRLNSLFTYSMTLRLKIENQIDTKFNQCSSQGWFSFLRTAESPSEEKCTEKTNPKPHEGPHP